MFFIREIIINPTVLLQFNKNPHMLIPSWWNISPNSKKANEIVQKIRDFYFSGGNITYNLRYEYSQVDK